MRMTGLLGGYDACTCSRCWGQRASSNVRRSLRKSVKLAERRAWVREASREVSAERRDNDKTG